jgi:hypothetical protein
VGAYWRFLLYYCLYYIACSKAKKDEAVWAPAGGQRSLLYYCLYYIT